ncbi:hypothetical protein H0H93_015286 [Arthromyces matolae]|nr:hypothetical protein H0H93_015286 [Arthromyces matolae]
MKATCFSTVSERTFAYAQLQEKIDVSERNLLTYKRSYNELNLTARLPYELLSEIFTWNLVIRRYKTREFGEYCTEVAAVCSHWRRIALSQPRLWNTFYFEQGLEWLTEIVIPRSQQAPLNIHLSLTNKNANKLDYLRVALADHHHRIQSLSLSSKEIDLSGPRYKLKRLLSSFTRAMPILRTFKVVSTGGYQYDLPRNFFGNMTQNLRTVALVSCRTPFESIPDLSTITSLTLGNRSDADKPLSLAELMKMLRAACNLTDLNLQHACLVPSSKHHNYGSFPTIETLTILDGARECGILLSCLSCPRIKLVNVSAMKRPGDTGPSQELFKVLMSHIRIKRFIFQPHSSVSLHGVQSADPTQTLEIKVTLNGIHGMLKSSSIKLSLLRRLILHRTLPSSLLDNKFSHLAKLYTLRFQGLRIDSIIAMLVPQVAAASLLAWLSQVTSNPELDNASSGEENITGMTIIVRKLQDQPTFPTVAQDNMRFKSIQRLVMAKVNVTPSGITALAANVHLRHILGRPLQELRVTGFTYGDLPDVDRDLSWIRRSVKSLHWNVRSKETGHPNST